MTDTPQDFVRLLEQDADKWSQGYSLQRDLLVSDRAQGNLRTEETLRSLISLKNLPFSVRRIATPAKRHPNKDGLIGLFEARYMATHFKLDLLDIELSDPDDPPDTWARGHLATRVADKKPQPGESHCYEFNEELVSVHGKLLSGVVVGIREHNPSVLGWEFGAWLRLDGDILTATLRQIQLGKTVFRLRPQGGADTIARFQEVAAALQEADDAGLVRGMKLHTRSSDGQADLVTVKSITALGAQHLKSTTTTRTAPHARPFTANRAISIPICCISYSWDSGAHKDWVRALATDLAQHGIEVRLDQFDVVPGLDIAQFMESAIREAHFVVCVCTPLFASKANSGKGGVGYEKNVITGEILNRADISGKFIPILRSGSADEAIPSYLKSKAYIDFIDEAVYPASLDALSRVIHGRPKHSRPKIGKRPDYE